MPVLPRFPFSGCIKVLILILYVVLGHSLELWKDAHKADPGQRGGFVCTFHESGPAILLGERRIPYKVTQDNTPLGPVFRLLRTKYDSNTERDVVGELSTRSDVSNHTLLGTLTLLAVEYLSFENRSRGCGIFCHLWYCGTL